MDVYLARTHARDATSEHRNPRSRINSRDHPEDRCSAFTRQDLSRFRGAKIVRQEHSIYDMKQEIYIGSVIDHNT